MNGKRLMQVFICLIVSTAMTLTFSAPVMAEDMQETIEHQAGFYYTIQRGDTLWDLSDKFFDTPWMWPELWQENEQIPNPHWIYPGERIRLFQKQGKDTFTFEVPELEEPVAQESAADTDLNQNASAEVEAAPLPKDTVYYVYPSIDSVGFIRKEKVSPLGFIFKIKDDKVLVSEGDMVYISYADKDALPIMQGGRYTIFRKLDPTRDRKRNRQLGGQYYILGIVEVTQKKTDFVIAKVVKSFRAIALNDFILPYQRRSPKIPITEGVPGLIGSLIISEEQSKIIGDLTLAFIDKGKADNIKNGQVYSIFYQEKEDVDLAGKKSVILDPIDFGKLIVLHTEEETATVLVTQLDQAATPGTLIRTPAVE
ncbi:MAG: LysM peptidoglycan-binding domain-containing protein [Deltaproteobacteria bacterium]|nr:LysM peptidoglycan-binding domain-containing protein [Deltaproteobacteria bacterium]